MAYTTSKILDQYYVLVLRTLNVCLPLDKMVFILTIVIVEIEPEMNIDACFCLQLATMKYLSNIYKQFFFFFYFEKEYNR